ncbi:MAG TPA: LPXTG cell wall anchor domain-containing protein [Acidobacteriota bacterium]
MRAQQVIGLVLIVGGLLALIYRGFSYTKETHDAKLGPIEFRIEEKEQVNIPVWAGAGAIVVGTGLLLRRRRKD